MEKMNIDDYQDNPAECDSLTLHDVCGRPVIAIQEDERADGSIDFALTLDLEACTGTSFWGRLKIAKEIMFNSEPGSLGVIFDAEGMAFIQEWLNARYPVGKIGKK